MPMAPFVLTKRLKNIIKSFNKAESKAVDEETRAAARSAAKKVKERERLTPEMEERHEEIMNNPENFTEKELPPPKTSEAPAAPTPTPTVATFKKTNKQAVDDFFKKRDEEDTVDSLTDADVKKYREKYNITPGDARKGKKPTVTEIEATVKAGESEIEEARKALPEMADEKDDEAVLSVYRYMKKPKK